MDASLIGYYSMLIATKKGEIKRLKEGKSQISQKREEWISNKPLYTQPELTQSNWRGHHAGLFKNNRSSIISSFQAVTGEQFQNIYSTIDQKITMLQSDIQYYQERISAVRREMELAEKNKK